MTSFPYEQPHAMASPGELRALIESRRSVRRFTPELVPDAVIRDCLELAVLAPSSCNLQPWSFQVIRDPALLAQLHALGNDRARLAADLDQARAEAAQIADVSREVTRRLDVAMTTIRDVLATHGG